MTGPLPLRPRDILLVKGDVGAAPPGFRAYLSTAGSCEVTGDQDPKRLLVVSPQLGYLSEGDILYVWPSTGKVLVLYRCNSNSNTIFLTERCNCNCIMCPQPYQGTEDDQWTQVWLDAIPWMSNETVELAISGGEPTMVPEGLLPILRACRNYLPKTALHVLTNGRMFNYLSLCQEILQIRHPDLVFGVPLYSDLAYLHDYVVQADGAFDQTVRGIMNLRRCGIHVEVRLVLLPHNVHRLCDFANFLVRNLPFIEHVALMGLEPLGNARARWDEVWIDPADYQPMLKEAVEILLAHRLSVSIYNHQLCVLDRSLWPLARKSISDWKTEYLEMCHSCSLCGECGGLFASSRRRHSRGLHVM